MTSPYQVLIAPQAVRHIESLAPQYQKLIIKFIEALSVNPRPPGFKKIEGMVGLHSHKVDHIRLIYKVDEHEILILTVK